MPINTSSIYTLGVLSGTAEPAATVMRILQQAGWIVHSGPLEEAWFQRLHQLAPDAVLLVTAPDNAATADNPAEISALDHCRQFRANHNCQAIPILLLASVKAYDADSETLRAGVADVIPWPCAPAELVARVTPYCELHRCRTRFAQQASAYQQAETILDRRTRELILIKEATQAFNSTLDFATVLQTVLREMHQLLNIVSTSFWIQDPQTGQLECLRATGPNSERLEGWRLTPGQGVTGQVAQNGTALIVHDTRADERHFKGVDEYTGVEIRSLMSLPLYAKDEQIGVLNLVDTAANSFSEDDLRLLEPIAAAAANAIKNARLFAELQEAKERAEQARQAAEAANQAKSLFLANMSHELRTPLNAILGFTYLLSQSIVTETAGTDEASRRDYVAPVARQELADEASRRDYVAPVARQELADEASRRDYVAPLPREELADEASRRDYVAPLPREELADEASRRDYVALIKRSGEHLLRLINQVLDLSKIEAQKMSVIPTDINLPQFLDDILDMFRLSAQEKHLRLMFECAPDVPGSIRSDEIKLRQILLNLLGNAIKFTARGHVALRVFTSETDIRSEAFTAVCSSPARIAAILEHRNTLPPRHPDTPFLIFEVADTGPGIAPDELETLFDAFVQTAVGTRSHEGTGLGLAISQKFVRLLEGDVHVDSTPGAGSSFWFDLPIVPVNPGAPRPPALPQKVVGLAPDQPRCKMLVVDDRPEERMLLMTLLESIGFDVQEAGSGQDAVACSAAWMPDLIWLDIRMPGMNGYAVIEGLEGQNPRPIIIGVTASTFLEGEEELMMRKCDGFLRKPFQIREIFDLIRQHLDVRFVYEAVPEPKSLQTLATVSAQDIAALPENLRSQLRQAVEMIDLNGTAALIDSFQPGHPVLAQQLKQLLKQYRFDILQNLFVSPAGYDPTPASCQGIDQAASELQGAPDPCRP